ncbi:hypothetical protein G3R49_01210 [Shewanella sp. WXL01]|uniref:hypothetical protein n=1 Tax=Shewanella sp. WXL01 TaxID=2709721 RepID=UPI0014382A16|nr:hypothetical protein [Shewanella sp. WXL01]NKF49195.1 hypothetical protein [Shewanella sp. WXL01]
MFKKIVLFIGSLLASSAYANVYQCGENRFQDRPCDENSIPLDLSGVGSIVVPLERTSVDSDEPMAVDQAKVTDQKNQISSYIRRQQINRDIDKLKRDRKRVLQNRDKQITQLRNSRNRANNNLAGATWEQSLAQEMTAVNQQADTEVATIDRQIEAYQKQLQNLRP